MVTLPDSTVTLSGSDSGAFERNLQRAEAMIAREAARYRDISEQKDRRIDGVARALCAAYVRGTHQGVDDGTRKIIVDGTWHEWVFAAQQLLARYPVDRAGPDDAHHAMLLADRLAEQDCLADAELVRRLAGIKQ